MAISALRCTSSTDERHGRCSFACGDLMLDILEVINVIAGRRMMRSDATPQYTRPSPDDHDARLAQFQTLADCNDDEHRVRPGTRPSRISRMTPISAHISVVIRAVPRPPENADAIHVAADDASMTGQRGRHAARRWDVCDASDSRMRSVCVTIVIFRDSLLVTPRPAHRAPTNDFVPIRHGEGASRSCAVPQDRRWSMAAGRRG